MLTSHPSCWILALTDFRLSVMRKNLFWTLLRIQNNTDISLINALKCLDNILYYIIQLCQKEWNENVPVSLLCRNKYICTTYIWGDGYSYASERMRCVHFEIIICLEIKRNQWTCPTCVYGFTLKKPTLSAYGWAEDTWEYWKQHDFEQLK